MRPLRVLHLITHLALGGATKNALAICRLLDSSRFTPTLLCGATSPKEAALEGVAGSLGVAVHTLPSLGRPIRPLADGRAYRELVAWLREHPQDVIHTHGSKAGILGRLAASAAGVPIIVHTVHGWGHHERQRRLLREVYVNLERRAAAVTDRIIVVANASRVQGLADGIGRPEQYVTIRGGIDVAANKSVRVDRRALRAALGIPLDAPVVGTVSRMAKQKAPQDFVRMAALIHVQMPEAHFVFVGGGPLQAKSQSQVRAAGLSGVVHLLGYRDDVSGLLRIFDVFVLNSLWEGLPAVFPQAMCAAVPIVATDVGGAGEAIVDGETGLLVPAGDPAAQAGHVLRLLRDPVGRAAMGQRGLERVEPEFCEQEMVRRIEDIYEECALARGLLTLPGTAAPPPIERKSPQETSPL